MVIWSPQWDFLDWQDGTFILERPQVTAGKSEGLPELILQSWAFAFQDIDLKGDTSGIL